MAGEHCEHRDRDVDREAEAVGAGPDAHREVQADEVGALDVDSPHGKGDTPIPSRTVEQPPEGADAEQAVEPALARRAGFRPMFLQWMADARRHCAPPGRDDPQGWASNGACAGYVATAARAGRLDEAWVRMLAAHDRTSDWPLPQGCRTNPPEGECPAEDVIVFDTYPDALRHFLVEHGYIAHDWALPHQRPAYPE